MAGKKRGRPASSNQVHVFPEFRKEPDIEKLGRALISIAVSIAEKNKGEETREAFIMPETSKNIKTQKYLSDRKGADMT